MGQALNLECISFLFHVLSFTPNRFPVASCGESKLISQTQPHLHYQYGEVLKIEVGFEKKSNPGASRCLYEAVIDRIRTVLYILKILFKMK